MYSQYFRIPLLLFIGFLLNFTGVAHADEGQPEFTPQQRLENILQAIKLNKQVLDDKQQELKKAASKNDKEILQNAIANLMKQQQKLEKSFITLATGGLDFTPVSNNTKSKLDWQADLMEIVKPVFSALKEATKKPREIDALKRAIERYQERIDKNQQAIDYIQMLEKQINNKSLLKRLQELKKQRINDKKNAKRLQEVAQFELNEKLSQKTSILDNTNEKLKHFALGKGLTLLYAVLTFSVILLIGNLLPKILPHKKNRETPFSTRLARIIFKTTITTIATLSMLVVFYLRNDWLFMGLAIIFLFALALSLKNTLPQYMNDIKMLLNISTVREGERVIYQGIPWKVEKLNIYSTLVNPELSGGKVKMSLKQLANLHSRPFDPQDPWFPCHQGDYVVLDGGQGQFGQVTFASPEFVQLTAWGGSIISYPTADFIQMNPRNLSRKEFSITCVFGLDYALQNKATTEVIDIFLQSLRPQIEAKPYGQFLTRLEVEFQLANSSSLDYAIIARFDGKAARYYKKMIRDLQKFAVNTCNEQNWSIPYQQIVVHQE